jgi:hypothetical protein
MSDDDFRPSQNLKKKSVASELLERSKPSAMEMSFISLLALQRRGLGYGVGHLGHLEVPV